MIEHRTFACLVLESLFGWSGFNHIHILISSLHHLHLHSSYTHIHKSIEILVPRAPLSASPVLNGESKGNTALDLDCRTPPRRFFFTILPANQSRIVPIQSAFLCHQSPYIVSTRSLALLLYIPCRSHSNIPCIRALV